MAKPRRLAEAERFDWLRLIRSDNVGPRTFTALLARCGCARKALEALPELARLGGLKRSVRIADKADIERELEAAAALGARFIASCEPEYPPALLATDGPPPLISVLGRDEALQQPALALVGSRNASAAGLAFADRLARGLGQAGYVVVSGLARGIDLRAHAAALETGTIGVLAGGLGKPYPPEAVAMIPRIAEYGATLSEMPIGWEPRGRDFPRRNRLVSGLCFGTIVIEASRGSGSLITARLAAEQNREVFAVPGSPLDPRAEGANDLLREGAHLCARVEDVLDVIEPLRARDPFETRFAPATLFDASDREGLDEPDAPGFDLGEEAAVAAVRRLLGPSPVSVDELARVADLDVRSVRMAIVVLDLAGRIEHSGGDRVALLAEP